MGERSGHVRPRIRHAVARHRGGPRALLAVAALAVLADPLVFERSIEHLLVGHSILLLVLLLVALLLGRHGGEATERDGPPSPPQSFVPALGFALLTPLYDAVVRAGLRERSFRSRLIEQAAIRPGDRVLDLGCGTGTLLQWMDGRQPAARYTGVDADADVLDRARCKLAGAATPIQLDRARADALPYADAGFDRVVSSLFFHHLERDAKQRVAAELLRVLRPGGELHIADFGRPRNGLMRALFVPVQLLDGFGCTRDNVAGRLPGLLAEAGFRAVAERQRIDTAFGTLALYSAVRPA
jgi:SAM-dependent methyltransferase